MPSDFIGLGRDVLDTILHHADVPTLRVLRMVSKAMNALAEPQAFKTTTIHISRFQHCSTDYLQSGLISEDSPAMRWTKTLIINSRTDVELAYDTGRREDAVACRVIQRMRQVETVR